MNPLEIVSERTTLKLIDLSDLANIHMLHSLPETDTYNALGTPTDIEETRAIIIPWIADNNAASIVNHTFKITEMATGQFLGLIGFKLGLAKYSRGEVWYKIHKDHWGKGYATEVLHELIEYGFDKLHLHRIEAGCAVENIGSIRVLEKVGMQREGRARQVLPLKSGWSDNFSYAILSSDRR